MRYTIFTIAAAATLASAQTTSTPAAASPTGTTVPIGSNCTPGGVPCALGANCYAVNSGLIPVCGNFQASCTRDEQCAYNTCNLSDGLCNGFLASSSAAPSASAMPTSGAVTPTNQGPQPAPSPTILAPAGSLPLGADCNPFVKPDQCANGVQCWASNAMLIARCGNFNAECSSDDQCAYNICSGGLCRGFKPSSEFPVMSSTSLDVMPALSTVTGPIAPMPSGTMEHMPSGIVPPHMINGTMTMVPTGTGAMPTGPANATSSGPAQFTGAAAVDRVAGGVMAVVFGAVAWAL
ncbi:uncharacterized protein J4E88_009882 [Alternaria novae-zelandiae]|uniref:uncharacterized protein n=1 Tax=Alternaria novae-zelandiae TaxID=430562 RepID=UPI0020C2AE5B|nr:uncharacterized protein J4E88_009882 [Alternaria novae-zelandiae]KAI4669600.1 hypothetical protein J4E88_009882 [Alternaria novae-zelandiae]